MSRAIGNHHFVAEFTTPISTARGFVHLGGKIRVYSQAALDP
ncbi:MAG TPA: hypothetical protein VGY54_09320 [Polyangiaceae bacterium]|nr:hypothetical protein [Polyangiaceae bacterium]